MIKTIGLQISHKSSQTSVKLFGLTKTQHDSLKLCDTLRVELTGAVYRKKRVAPSDLKRQSFTRENYKIQSIARQVYPGYF